MFLFKTALILTLFITTMVLWLGPKGPKPTSNKFIHITVPKCWTVLFKEEPRAWFYLLSVWILLFGSFILL